METISKYHLKILTVSIELFISFSVNESFSVIKMDFVLSLSLSDIGDVVLSKKSVRFSCKYARLVTSAQNYTVESFADDIDEVTDDTTGIGELPYSMEIISGSMGGFSTIKVNADHGFTNIYPRLISCSVSTGINHKSWPIHSFQNNKICSDSRLGVSFTKSKPDGINPAIEFQMRSFRFQDGSSELEDQEQQIVCTVMLQDTVPTIESNDCACYDETDCGK